jgi:hypothetical protein
MTTNPQVTALFADFAGALMTPHGLQTQTTKRGSCTSGRCGASDWRSGVCRFQPPSESERQLLGPVAMRAIIACGLRPGRVDWYVQPALGTNACAPGRHSVAVTDGALRSFVSGRLPADQLMAVLVHEIGHHETRVGPLRLHHDVAGGPRADSVPPGAAGVAGAVLELLGGSMARSCS